MAGPLAFILALLRYNGAVMKFFLIIPIALIAGVVMSGCSSSEDDESGFQPVPGRAAVEGEVGAETAESVGTKTREPL